jgi:hypothetical protein
LLIRPLQSLLHLTTCARELSDIYALATNGLLPRLRSLRVILCYWDVEDGETPASMRPIPSIRSLFLPELELIDMDLRRSSGVEWASIEPLTSHSVMPRLRYCTLTYELQCSADIRLMFDSPLFGNDERNVRLCFAIHLNACHIGGPEYAHLSQLCTGRYNETYLEYVSSV